MQNDDEQSAPELVPDAAALTSLNAAEFTLAEAANGLPDSKDLGRTPSLWPASIFGLETPLEVDDETLYGEGPLNSDEPEPPARTRRSRYDVPWHDKRKIEGYAVTRSLTKTKRDEGMAAWRRARLLKMPLTLHFVFRPDIDHLDPLGRMRVWDGITQKIRSHCSWRGFPAAFIMARESDPGTHRGEHAHYLVHCPRCERDLFKRVVSGWCDNAVGKDVDQREIMRGGKQHSAASYILKASPQAAHADHRVLYRRSGAVVGPRTKITRNIGGPKAIAEAEITMRAKERTAAERADIAYRQRHAEDKSAASP